MKIEDKEIRELFERDSLEQIQKIESGLLVLEENPKSIDLLKSIFREAHSLKGSAGILGLKEIETITHVLEDYLGKYSKGYGEYKPEDNDRILFVLDQLKLLVHQAITGDKVNVNTKFTVDVLLGKELPSKSTNSNTNSNKTTQETNSPPITETTNKSTTQPLKIATPDTIPDSKPENNKSKLQDKSEPLPQKKFKIETMRVDPSKLDFLLANTGELIIAKNTIQKRSLEISELLMLIEEFSKIWRKQTGMDLKAKSDWDSILKKLTDLKVKSQQDATKLDLIASKIDDGVQKVRLLPLSSVFEIFTRVVRDLSRELGKEAYLTIEGNEVNADKLIIEECKDSLMHLVRNSLDHGIESRDERIKLNKPNPARIRIAGSQKDNFIQIVVEDDGKGLDIEKIKEKAISKGIYNRQELEEMTESQIFGIILRQGFSTRSDVTSISGRGYGMDIVKNFADRFKGSIEIESSVGIGTKFTLLIPTNFSTYHVLIVGVNGWKYGIPTEFVKQSLVVIKEEIRLIESKPTIRFGNEPVRIVSFAEYFSVPYQKKERIKKNKRYETCIVLEYNGDKFGIIVDYIYEKQEILLKPFLGILEGIKIFSGSTILESGEICCVANVPELFSLIKSKPTILADKELTIHKKKKNTVLVVEDSLVTRAQLQRIIEGGGYTVSTASNGQEGLEKCKISTPDLILTDIEMPVLDGYGFIKEIKKQNLYKNIPIIILTSLGSNEQIQIGRDLGADNYLVKSQFDQSLLLETVERLVGG